MKKIISVWMLTIFFISIFQKIVLGVTESEQANLIIGTTIKKDVQFFENEIWYVIGTEYLHYQDMKGNHLAYCISYRRR